MKLKLNHNKQHTQAAATEAAARAADAATKLVGLTSAVAAKEAQVGHHRSHPFHSFAMMALDAPAVCILSIVCLPAPEPWHETCVRRTGMMKGCMQPPFGVTQLCILCSKNVFLVQTMVWQVGELSAALEEGRAATAQVGVT